MKAFREYLFGKESECYVLCEFLETELKLYSKSKNYKPEYIGVEAKDDASGTTLFKRVSPAIRPLGIASECILAHLSRQLFPITLIKKKGKVKTKFININVYECASEKDQRFLCSNKIGFYRHNLTARMNSTSFQNPCYAEFNRVTHDILHITATLRILLYHSEKTNTINKSQSLDIGRLDRTASVRHTARLKSEFNLNRSTQTSLAKHCVHTRVTSLSVSVSAFELSHLASKVFRAL